MKKIAIILTAPSGAGKRTLTEHLLGRFPNIEMAVSLTTRARRENEKHGVHYDFVTKKVFEQKKEAKGLIEWNEHFGNFYAAQKKEASRIWAKGRVPLFELEVNGAVNAKEYFGDQAALLFIDIPSLEILSERLHKRGTESEKEIQERLDRAEYERSFREEFDYVIMNDDLGQAKDDIQAVVGRLLT